MFLGGYRLLFQDLHQGRTGALFFSLLLYGAVLAALPRLKKAARKPLLAERQRPQAAYVIRLSSGID
jgi:hypothetical protein